MIRERKDFPGLIELTSYGYLVASMTLGREIWWVAKSQINQPIQNWHYTKEDTKELTYKVYNDFLW